MFLTFLNLIYGYVPKRAFAGYNQKLYPYFKDSRRLSSIFSIKKLLREQRLPQLPTVRAACFGIPKEVVDNF